MSLSWLVGLHCSFGIGVPASHFDRFGAATPGRFFICVRFGHIHLEHLFAYDLADVGDIGAAGEFKFHLSQAGEPELQLAVEIQNTSGFYAERLNLAIGKTGEIFLLSCEALDIDGENSFVGKDNPISDGLIGLDDFLAGNKHRRDVGFIGGVGNWAQFHVAGILKVDHDYVLLFIFREHPGDYIGRCPNWTRKFISQTLQKELPQM